MDFLKLRNAFPRILSDSFILHLYKPGAGQFLTVPSGSIIL